MDFACAYDLVVCFCKLLILKRRYDRKSVFAVVYVHYAVVSVDDALDSPQPITVSVLGLSGRYFTVLALDFMGLTVFAAYIQVRFAPCNGKANEAFPAIRYFETGFERVVRYVRQQAV